jgi:hypothetical protein
MSCCCGGFAGGLGGATLASARLGQWNPQPNSATAPLADGVPTASASGTAQAEVVVNNSDLMQSARRISYISAAAINSVAGARANQFCMTNGCVAGQQPLAGSRYRVQRWQLSFVWWIGDAVLNAEARMFVGALNSGAAPTAVDPATLLNAIGFGCNTGDTTLKLYARDAGANAQTIDLGANFPVNTTNKNALYRTIIACEAGATANPVIFDWQVERLNTGDRASGKITSLAGPGFGVNMAPQLWRSTGPTVVSAVVMGLVSMSLVTDI